MIEIIQTVRSIIPATHLRKTGISVPPHVFIRKGRKSASSHNRVNGAVSCWENHGRLFPQLPALVVTPREVEEGPPLLMEEEIDAAIGRVCTKAKKAPGPDGIWNSVWTVVLCANSTQSSMQY